MVDIILKPYDNVYHKLSCEPAILKEISEYFSFPHPQAQYQPTVRSKAWDGRIKLVNYTTGLLYIGLTEKLEEFCKENDYSIESRVDSGDREFSIQEAKEFIATLKLPFEVRQYQLEAFVHAVRKGRTVLLSAVSSGKSLIIYLLLRYLNKRAIIIVPTVGLVNQMIGDFASYGYKEPVLGIMYGSEKDTNTLFTVSTWQSAILQNQKWFDKFEVVIGDEAHTWKAKSLISIMKSLKNCEVRVGTTGTLGGEEVNELQVISLFGPVKTVIKARELIDQGYASPLKIKIIVLKYPDIARKAICGGKPEYHREMSLIRTYPKRNRFITNLALSLDGNTFIVFNHDDQGKILFEMIKAKNPDKELYYISGETTPVDREDIRQKIIASKSSITVASVKTTGTGINVPNLSNIIMVLPTKSDIYVQQGIGRSLRLHADKACATWYDICDDLSYGDKQNHTLEHFFERVKIYIKEKFDYKIYKVNLL